MKELHEDSYKNFNDNFGRAWKFKFKMNMNLTHVRKLTLQFLCGQIVALWYQPQAVLVLLFSATHRWWPWLVRLAGWAIAS
jgi:hypothetical protein